MTDKKKPAITMNPVSGSTSIKAHGYDAASKTLAVTFHSGATYHYHDVPAGVAAELGKAKSVGGHFAANVRNKFKGTAQ